MYDSPYSITEIGTLVRVFALVKTDLKKLVTEPQPLIQNQDVKEPTLFLKVNASVLIYALKFCVRFKIIP